MKRILSCALIMALAVSLTVFLPVMAGTKAEAARKAKEAGDATISEPPMNYNLGRRTQEKRKNHAGRRSPSC